MHVNAFVLCHTVAIGRGHAQEVGILAMSLLPGFSCLDDMQQQF